MNKIEKMNAMTFIENCGNGLNIYIQQCESRYFPEEFHVIQQAMMRVNGGCCYKGVPFRVMELDSALENRIIDVQPYRRLVLFKYVLVQTSLYSELVLPRIILLADYTYNSPNDSQIHVPCVIDEEATYAVKAYLRKYLSEHNDINKDYSSREWAYFNYGVSFESVSVADHCETVLTDLLQHLYNNSDFDVFGTNMKAATLYRTKEFKCDHDWQNGLVDISEDLQKQNGDDCELGILQEECAELIQAISKYKRKAVEYAKNPTMCVAPIADYLEGRKKEIAYEMADVLNIMETCCNILNIDGLEIEINKVYKIVRQGRRLYRRKPIPETRELEHLEP